MVLVTTENGHVTGAGNSRLHYRREKFKVISNQKHRFYCQTSLVQQAVILEKTVLNNSWC